MRRYAGVLLIVLVLAAAVWAGDPWKQKDWKQWDAKDVQAILNESPWVKEVQAVGASGVEDDSKVGPRSTRVGPGLPRGAVGTAIAPAETGVPAAPEQLTSRQASFLMRWSSARTLRQALLRALVLRGRISESEAENYLAQSPPHHEVTLTGTDMTLFAGSDEKQLLEKAFLRVGKSKETRAPARVELQRGTDRDKISGVIFHFARTDAAGQPVIAGDVKSLEFVCQVGGVVLKAKFEPQKMVGRQGPDL